MANTKKIYFETHEISYISKVSEGLYFYSNSGGYKPYAANSEGLNMNEEVYDIPYTSDSAPMQGFSGKKFKEESIEVPIWIDSERYIKEYRALHNFWWICKYTKLWYSKNFNQEIHDKLMNELEGFEQYITCSLISQDISRMRSDFRISLKKQAENWVSGNSQYETPFSYKQLNCLSYDRKSYEMAIR